MFEEKTQARITQKLIDPDTSEEVPREKTQKEVKPTIAEFSEHQKPRAAASDAFLPENSDRTLNHVTEVGQIAGTGCVGFSNRSRNTVQRYKFIEETPQTRWEEIGDSLAKLAIRYVGRTRHFSK
jgi:hypothetical protein